jgi:hypothetical protein
MHPEQEIELIQTVSRIDERVAILPSLVIKVDTHDKNFAYYKGAIAVIGFIIIVFGGVLCAHVLSGK